MYFATWRLAGEEPPLSPIERSIVADVLRHFHGVRYDLVAYVVMDDHVHAVVSADRGWQIHQVLHSWKSYTAHELQRRARRRGPVWQHESWDRIIRDQTELEEKVGYVLNNPRKRWPDADDYPWVWASE